MKRLSMLFLSLGWITVYAACGGSSSLTPTTAPTRTETITYTVTSTFATAGLITYVSSADAGGTANQTVTNVALPWSVSLRATATGRIVTINAYLTQGPSNSTITVNIFSNGMLVQTATSTGVGAVAHAEFTT